MQLPRAPLLLVLLARRALANCDCTGVGTGTSGIARGLPETYGTSCAAWDDGDCSAHACGTLDQCNELYPDATWGTWCCRKWCYVDPSCTHGDVQPTTFDGSGSLYYSYQACDGSAATYTAEDCPWQTEISFEQAAAAILVTEKIGELLAHDDSGSAGLAVVRTATSETEVAITAGKDAKLCVFELRDYGGRRAFCSAPATDPVIDLAATGAWIATATEGLASIDFWALEDDSDISLSFLGRLSNAAPRPLRYLKHTRMYGLLAASEDNNVKVWPVTDVAATVAGSEASSGQLGPFTWVPSAMEELSWGPNNGLAVASFADIEVWVHDSISWSRLARLSGHSRLVTNLAFFPQMGLLASSSLDSNLAIWHFANGEWQLASYLYDHSHPVTALSWIPSGPLLASGDAGELILWRPLTAPTCEFTYLRNYYLAGFNRYVVENHTTDQCRQLCCDNAWCMSFDYADAGDGVTHGPRTCWLSASGEGINGGGGLVYDSTGKYHYYEISKRGSRFMSLSEPKGIGSMRLAPHNGLLLSSNNEDGVVDVWKFSTSTCPDGQMSRGDGASCMLCPLGRAGRGGVCPACRPGFIANEEGLLECEPCPRGAERPGVGGITCATCRAGYYADEPATETCHACASGHFNDNVGSTTADDCRRCPVSTFSTQPASTACEACTAGMAHDFTAVTSHDPACTHCHLCGTVESDMCPVPKSTGDCRNCPEGMVTSSERYMCEYCPLGEIPNQIPLGSSCIAFRTGDFDAVPSPNNRVCHDRGAYSGLGCPLVENQGWGEDGPPDDDRGSRFASLSAEEHLVCSRLHCMGAVRETQEVARRMLGTCSVDEGMAGLCRWSKDRLNEDIAERQRAAQEREAADELQQRTAKCGEVCDCNRLCEDVTQEEDDREQAFEVLPFGVTSCEVRDYNCRATCESSRPAKVVVRDRHCNSYQEVSEIVVQRTHLPRCEADCGQCPSGKWRSESFETCDQVGGGLEDWEIALIVVFSVIGFCLLVCIVWCVCTRRCCCKRRVNADLSEIQ